jgi:hypothetical protein
MRTQFFKTRAIGLCLILAACQPGSGVSGRTETVILQGDIRIVAPRGYCLAPQAGRGDDATAAVFLGRCTAQTQAPAALVALSIGPKGSGSVMTAGTAAVAGFFQSQAGRAALSRSGKAAAVKVISARGNGSVLWLHLADAETGTYWRGITAINGRLVTLSATGIAGFPLSPEVGQALLQVTYARLQQANR